jgi:prevent-host-death family protein
VREVQISDFKARCLALLEDVERTGESLTVLRRGKPIALVLPPPRATYSQFELFGSVECIGDVISPAMTEDDWDCLQ